MWPQSITKVVALETATTGVTCNAVCPGWVLTPLVQKQIDDIALKGRYCPKGKAGAERREDEAAWRETTVP